MSGTLNVALSFNSDGDTRLSRPGDQQAATKSFSYGPGTCIHYILNTARTEVHTQRHPTEQVLQPSHRCCGCAGTILGQTDLWLSRPRAGTAVAGPEPCTLFVVSRAAFDTLRLKSPEVASWADNCNGACAASAIGMECKRSCLASFKANKNTMLLTCRRSSY